MATRQARLSETHLKIVEKLNFLHEIASSGGSTYDSSTRQKVIEADYIYHSWERTDGAGYIAKRVELGTNVITEATGSLPVPVLTTLTYS